LYIGQDIGRRRGCFGNLHIVIFTAAEGMSTAAGVHE
jgi:hypothetical protein